MRVFLVIFALISIAPSAFAQSMELRINRLERDIQLMQKSMYQDAGGNTSSAPAVSGGSSADTARMEVRFQQMEERIRHMQGTLEELAHANRRQQEALERFQKDVDMRLSDMTSSNATAITAPEDADASATTPAEATAISDAEAVSPPASSPDQVLKLPTPANADTTQFANARDHYNHAFRLLTQTEYDAAGTSFENFISQYPKDPLIGNAYYWAGETHYVRQNFIKAADYFRQGYESLPQGPKAGDNLLKLAMSLSAVEQNDKACVVLGQVLSKFGANSVTLKQKASAERNRIGCK